MLKAFKSAEKYTISRFFTQKPVLLTHFLTSKCNCKCKVCDIWKKKYETREMETAEVYSMLDEAKKLHFAAYLMWGGESLLRPDALDILTYAHDRGFYTSLITNGTLLPQKALEIANAVDLTWVSIDYYSNYHDDLRGLKGTFDSAIEGVKKLKNNGGKVAVNCVLSKLNKDAVKNVAALASSLKVRVAFDPMEVFPGFNQEYALSLGERRDLFSEILELKKSGYPILNSYEFLNHLTSRKEYSCAQPKIFLNVQENGEIFPFWCRKTNRLLGDLRKQSLSEILHSAPYKEFAQTAEGCNLCNNSVTAETSFFYSPQTFLMNSFKVPSPILEFVSYYGGFAMPEILFRTKKTKLTRSKAF